MSDFNLDLDRASRLNFPEIIYGENKTLTQLKEIIESLIENKLNVLATRIIPEKAEPLKKHFPNLQYDLNAKTLSWQPYPPKPVPGLVAIVTAGTSDVSVALEAKNCLNFLGAETRCFFDVGVAGLNRLLNCLPSIKTCDVVIAIAGFEGALPSVLGGLISAPVIAVPTSVGYGVAEGGKTALNAMLVSCASGIVVVNIDGGFNAAVASFRILNRPKDLR